MTAPQYPEHEKLKAISAKSQAIGDFLTWARATLCVPHHHVRGADESDDDTCYSDGRRSPSCGLQEGEFLPVRETIEQQLAEYFGIDLRKIEDEKRAMLDELRAGYANTK